MTSVPGTHHEFLTARCQLFQPIFAHRLQHSEAALAPRTILRPQQTHVRKLGNTVENPETLAHGLGRLQREAADEDGQAPKQDLLVCRQQIVAPGNGVAHRPLARRHIPRPAGEQRQPLLQSGEHPAGDSTVTRAAASSIARGSPSSR